MPQRLVRRCRAGPLPAGPAARRLHPGYLQRGASARLLPSLSGLCTTKGYGGGGGGAPQLGAGPFPAQPPGRGFDPPPALASSSVDAARKERALDSPPPPTLACGGGGGGGSQGDEEAHASSSAAEELSPAPSESSKASPEKDSLGKQGALKGSAIRRAGRQADPEKGRSREPGVRTAAGRPWPELQAG